MTLGNREGGERPLVLLADDDPFQRTVARLALAQAGFDVIEASDGAEAVDLFMRNVPELTILDVVMPKLDGYAACSAIRETAAGMQTPILIATSLTDVKGIERAYAAGATDFIGKPIPMQLLGHRARYLYRAGRSFADLALSRRRLMRAEEVARLGSWDLDPETKALDCSDQAKRLLGYVGSGTISWRQFVERVHVEDGDRVVGTIETLLRGGTACDLEFRVVAPNTADRNVAVRIEYEQDRACFIGVIQDVTERRKIEARIQHLAHHDALTNLPNRTLFRDRLENALSRAKRAGDRVAVMVLDTDRFKDVNDTMGHAVGDLLLQSIGRGLQEAVRGSDTVARIGGDEFAVIQVGVNQPESSAILAHRLLSILSAPLRLAGHEVRTGMSIGVALYPDHGLQPDELLARADVALYRAKANGRGQHCHYDPSMDEALRQRRELEGDLTRGLERGWFELHYQPQVRVGDGTIVGVEALVRLRHPTKGLIPPSNFIPLAEESGLINEIGAWVLRTACHRAAAWMREGKPLRVGVNLSANQVLDRRLIGLVEAALAESGLPPDLLEVEITETVLLRDTAAALDIVTHLRQIGLSVAMDDFGTGYSSLSYLLMFPFDRIKIDGSFVRQLQTSPHAASIVRAIIGLGRSLDMAITAEGVEDIHQLAILERESCDEAQGFYFSRPLPEVDLRRLVGLAARDGDKRDLLPLPAANRLATA